jgi:N,N'-diacetylchitobiose transport system permease protein
MALRFVESRSDALAAHRRRQRVARLTYNGIALGIMALVAFPIYWMFLTSFRDRLDIRRSVELHPFGGTLDNYRTVFDQDFFGTAFMNSLKVTGLVVPLTVLFAFLAAVAVSRFRFRGRVAFLVAILLLMMVPSEAIIIPLVKVLDGWQLRNTILGLTVVYLAFVLPFTIWLMRGFVAGVPQELEEAAMVDGTSRMRAFITITLPLVAPGMVAVGIFAFMQTWNEFTLALVVMDRPEMETLPLWLQSFNDGQKGTDWGGVMAGSLLITLPIFLLFVFIHRRIATGMTAGAVKG